MPNYNGGATLDRALRSIVEQDYPALELIVADAESDDGSHRVLENYGDSIARLIRRRDNGQADALNHAFSGAQGDIRGWLCSDDELLPGALHHVAEIFAGHPEVDLVAGATERVFEGHFRNFVPVPPGAWDNIGAMNGFDQPAVFWRTSLHQKTGELDTSFRLAFDWDFWCRMREAGAALHVTDRALARYYFSGRNKSSVAGHDHVEEGYRIIRRYGPLDGRVAPFYRFLYRHFDLGGALDDPPSCSSARLMFYRFFRALFDLYPGRRWMNLYNWHFASLQERNLDWWDYKRATLEELRSNLPVKDAAQRMPDWTGGTLYRQSDRTQPVVSAGVNVVLNRKRLAAFSAEFAGDADLRDFILLDAISSYSNLGLSSGPGEPPGSLAPREVRLWEYVWLFKVLGLRGGGLRVLNAGGAASHLTFLAALAGNEVLSVDPDARRVDLCRRAAAAMGLDNVRAVHGELTDLSGIQAESFDIAIACSVLEHMTAGDQAAVMSQIARVLKPKGVAGLVFDYGPGSTNPSIYLPPPHEPPSNAAEAVSRYARSGLRAIGNALEDPVPGNLYAAEHAPYSVASLFLSQETGIELAQPAPAEAPSILGSRPLPDLAGMARESVSLLHLRREREEAEKQTWVMQFNELNKRINVLEEAAQQRLVVLERSHGEAERVREQLLSVTAEAEKRLAVINELTAAVQDREMLRTEADKRLRVINELKAALDERDRRIAELTATLQKFSGKH